MMSRELLGVVEPPATFTVYWKACPGGAGGAPIWPAATCAFCCGSREITSCVVRPRAWSLLGVEPDPHPVLPAPKTLTSPTPGQPASSSLTWSVA